MDKRYVQFATATNLNKLFDELRPLLTIDPLEFWRDYFDIDTCLTDGLDNWGRILDFDRIIQISTADNGVFGFGEGNYPIPPDGYPQNFNNGNFFDPNEAEAFVSYRLTDYEYRIVLKFRYASLTSNLSMKAINKIMNDLIRGINEQYKCAVIQSDVMQLTYKFNFTLQPWQKSIFTNRNALPVPAGVTAILLENQTL